MFHLSSGPFSPAAEYDWQTLYKGKIRTLLSDGQPHYLLLADVDLDGTPELFGGSGPLSPLVPLATCSAGQLEELSLASGSQTPTSVLQNLRLSFNTDTGEALLTCEGNDPAGGNALWELSLEKVRSSAANALPTRKMAAPLLIICGKTIR